LIWKLQKVYDVNPDCGLGFLDLVKIKYREARLLCNGERAFSFAYFTINPGNYKQKTKIKRQKLRLTIRKYQGVSRRIIFDYQGVSESIKMYHFLSSFCPILWKIIEPVEIFRFLSKNHHKIHFIFFLK
jgi:hypothetical protein